MSDIRFEKFKEVSDKYEKQKDFAEAVGMAAAHVSQILSGKRNIGDAVASRIEARLNLPRGWMDGKPRQELADWEWVPNTRKQDINAQFNLTQEERAARPPAAASALAFSVEEEDAIFDDLRRCLLARGITFDEIEPRARVSTKYGIRRYDFCVLRRIYIDLVNITQWTTERMIADAFILRDLGYKYAVLVRRSASTELGSNNTERRYNQAIDALLALEGDGMICAWSEITEPLDRFVAALPLQ